MGADTRTISFDREVVQYASVVPSEGPDVSREGADHHVQTAVRVHVAEGGALRDEARQRRGREEGRKGGREEGRKGGRDEERKRGRDEERKRGRDEERKRGREKMAESGEDRE